MDKKGIEVGVNIIVVLILSIVVFGFGIKYVYDIYRGSADIIKNIEPSVSQKLDELLITENSLVVAYPDSRKVSVGDSYVFGIAVRNVGDGKHFYVDAEKGVAVKPDGKTPISNRKVNLLVAPKKFAVNKDQAKKLGLAVQVPPGTERGTYEIRIYVCNDAAELNSCPANSDRQYDNVQKVYVIVA